MSRRGWKSYICDPLWITAKFRSSCSCGAVIEKGDDAFYYPSERKAVCEPCGHKGQADLDAEKANEVLHVF